MLAIENQDVVHGLRRDAASGQRGLDDIGFTTQLHEINHSPRLVKGALRFVEVVAVRPHAPSGPGVPSPGACEETRRDLLGSIVVSYAIEVSHLAVHFAALRAVDDVSMQVSYGQVTSLLGPNGAGKTTLVETLLGFRSPDAGRVRVHGLDPVRDHAEVVVRTGALLQRGGVWFPMTPAQVLELTASYYDQPRAPRELLTLLSLDDCARTPWRRLSGGEQQRTLLALALLGRPRVLVLDEPTTAVDPEGRQVIRELIRAERDRGCALLITTHELTEAERTADDVVIMNHGRVVVQGTLDQLAGDAVLIVETSRPVDPVELGRRLRCAVTSVEPTRLHCATDASPERVALVNAYVSESGATLTSLRTRATLEERYLDLIAEPARTTP